jgi:hypothetical protein
MWLERLIRWKAWSLGNQSTQFPSFITERQNKIRVDRRCACLKYFCVSTLPQPNVNLLRHKLIYHKCMPGCVWILLWWAISVRLWDNSFKNDISPTCCDFYSWAECFAWKGFLGGFADTILVMCAGLEEHFYEYRVAAVWAVNTLTVENSKRAAGTRGV